MSGNRARSLFHGLGGTLGIRQGDLAIGGLGKGILLGREQVVQRAPQDGEGTRSLPQDLADSGDARGVRFDQPAALAVLRLGEGIGERRAGIPDRWRQRLPAVQVAERGVVEAVEQVQRNGADSADAQVPFTVRADAAARESVGQHHGVDLPVPGPGCHIGPDPPGGGACHLEVAGGLNAQLLGNQPGLKPRNAVDGQYGTVSSGVQRK